MRLLPLVGLFLVASVAYAYTDEQAPPAFRTDPSRPIPVEQISPAQADIIPVSTNTTQAWQNYDSPLRDCVKGDSIIPSSGHDAFSFLFKNGAQVDVTMSIQGWKQKGNQCLVNFSQATNILYCHFDKTELTGLMETILNSSQFDPTGPFAQTLATNCSPSQNLS